MRGREQARVVDGVTVLVRRSSRRRKTVSAYREHGRTVVAIPGRFSRAEEEAWVRRMLARLAAGDRRRCPDEDALTRRARELAERYLDERAVPTSVTWVDNQGSRWGSCTPDSGTIRISDRVQGMPGWVLDYVLLHELAHLIEAGHDENFWALLERYPKTERARGFLLGVTHTEEN
ncbi:M48 family metallopeptidase [Ruania alkalisoli]|uniref:M48 family metallopeptidase n=1 Tax=Ruania alkalisoli TaxID=2779775 RepID=A0A7M1SW69_9MICO|nr:M48 family metallopeptidase [Ruania alkalisoli]QOR71785.1 M48 family metallopeptidase [Ruania alkalisoli]